MGAGSAETLACADALQARLNGGRRMRPADKDLLLEVIGRKEGQLSLPQLQRALTDAVKRDPEFERCCSVPLCHQRMRC